MLRLASGSGIRQYTTTEGMRSQGSLGGCIDLPSRGGGGGKYDLRVRTAAIEHLSLILRRDEFMVSHVYVLLAAGATVEE